MEEFYPDLSNLFKVQSIKNTKLFIKFI